MAKKLQIGSHQFGESDSGESTVKLTWLIDQLLELIVQNLSDADNVKNVPFCLQLERHRREIARGRGEFTPFSTAQSILDLCFAQFRQFHAKRLRRDECFADIIKVLKKTHASLEGESKAFHDLLMNALIRIDGLIELNDVHQFKAKIAAEMDGLKRFISETWPREQTRYEQLFERIVILQKNLEEARAEASTDALTQIANSRNFDYVLLHRIEAHDKSESFTVALFDLDDFKQIIETLGRLIGDQILAFAALEIGTSIRASDFLARYDDDRFAILSAGMGLQTAYKRFSKIVQRLEAARLQFKDGEKTIRIVAFKASCGVAEYALGESAEELMSRVHDALREARLSKKSRGGIDKMS